MKILQVIGSLEAGGAEKLILETIPLYFERGFEIDLLLLNGTEYSFLTELTEQSCCNIYCLGNSSVYNPLLVFKIIPFLKKYDLVHVHLFPSLYWVVLAKLISCSNVKLIFTEHAISNRRRENPLLRKIDKYIYVFYAGIICVAKDIKKTLISHTQLPYTKFYLIENGVNLVNLNRSMPHKKEEISSALFLEDKILIQVAGFKEPKDQITLIRAMALLPNNIKLLLVGDGILKKYCEALVTELQLNKRILFLGMRMDVPQLLKTADIVVLSSKHEGLSLASIEGMASGKPLIASDVPGLTKVVENAGILFPVGDKVQLAKEILELIENPVHYRFVAAACQKRATEYDLNEMVEKHIELYDNLSKKQELSVLSR